MGNYSVNNFGSRKSYAPNVGGQQKIPSLAEGFKYMDMQSLLDYCQLKLKQADQGIQEAMAGLDNVTKLQQSLSDLKGLDVNGGDYATQKAILEGKLNQAVDNENKLNSGNPGDQNAAVAFFNINYGAALSGPGDAAKAKAHAIVEQHKKELADLEKTKGGESFMGRVEEVAQQLEAAGQTKAAEAIRAAAKTASSGKKEDIDSFQKCVDAQIGSVGASREMAMIRMQALVSQRGTMLQMVTNMSSAFHQAAMAIAQNIKS